MFRSAEISNDRSYRYALIRTWDEDLSKVMFIGLNPSTADEIEDDPTVRRCINFCKAWGAGGLVMANLFAYRATDPDKMKRAHDPIGPDNDEWLKKLAAECEVCVAAWGNHGAFMGRSKSVSEMIPDLHFLARNKSGEPRHPLYLNGSLTPQKNFS